MNIQTMINDVLKSKSGYVDHPEHKGGPTHFGINKTALNEYNSKTNCNADIQALSEHDARAIYQTVYYSKPGIDLLPELLQPMLFDMAVKNGAKVAIKLLQFELKDCYFLYRVCDGISGPVTIAAAHAAVKILGTLFLNYLVDRRIARYLLIVEFRPSLAEHLDGWIAHAETFRPQEFVISDEQLEQLDCCECGGFDTEQMNTCKIHRTRFCRSCSCVLCMEENDDEYVLMQ